MKKGFFAPVAMLAITITLFGACASEEENVGGGSGEKVTVHFTVSQQSFSASETASVRSSSEDAASIISEKLTHVSGDLYARTALVEHTAPATRATTALEDNKKVRILAYHATTNALLSYADYKMAGGQLVADGTPPLSLVAGTYNFVAYSYNSTTLPPYNATTITGISSNTDELLYVRKNAVPVLANAADISLTLAHLFAKVQLKVSTTKLDQSPVVPNITAVTASLPTGFSGDNLSLNVYSGTLSGGAAASLNFPTFGQTTVESDFAYVYPNASGAGLVLNVGTMDIAGFLGNSGGLGGSGGNTVYYYAYEENGTRMLLQANHWYTLTIDFQYLKFAGSNIYWDETLNNNAGNLTFDPHGTNTHAFYQGVFFKWGSLVGIAGKSSNGSLNTSDALFVPTTNSAIWTMSTLTNMVAAKPAEFPKAEHLSIPYVDDITVPTLQYNTRRSDDLLTWQKAHYNQYRGDICRKLTADNSHPYGTYRIPTSIEWEVLMNHSTFHKSPSGPASDCWHTDGTTISSTTFGTTSGTIAYGQYVVPNYRWISSTSLILPASGYRMGASGSAMDVNTRAVYQSSTAYNTTDNWAMEFYNNDVIPSQGKERARSFQVRCVKIEDSAPAPAPAITVNTFNEQTNSVSAGVTN